MDNQPEGPPSPTWKQLAEQASKEEDPLRLMKLVQQMLAAMDEEKQPARRRNVEGP